MLSKTTRNFLLIMAILPILTISIDPEYQIERRFVQAIGAVINTIEDLTLINKPTTNKKDNSINNFVKFWCTNSNNPKYSKSHQQQQQRQFQQQHQFSNNYPKNQQQKRIILKQTFIGDPAVQSKIDFSLPIAYLIHGWFDSVHRKWINEMIIEYIKHIPSNICVVDWERLALTEYTIAANNTKRVANHLVEFILFLESINSSGGGSSRGGDGDGRGGIGGGSGSGAGCNRSNTHDTVDDAIDNNDDKFLIQQTTLIGHSFGAQIAGHAGRKLNGQIGRIYGLDPAGWFFTKPTLLNTDLRLDKTDAKFVQCIHTARNFIGLGSEINCGHQDFHPNDGLSPQPGCHDPITENGHTPFPLLCSHFKAIDYFHMSIDPKNKQLVRGWKCSMGYSYWSLGLCQSEESDYFGVHSKQSVYGNLYFRTDILASKRQ